MCVVGSRHGTASAEYLVRLLSVSTLVSTEHETGALYKDGSLSTTGVVPCNLPSDAQPPLSIHLLDFISPPPVHSITVECGYFQP